MKKKKSSKASKAYLDKIKSLGIQTSKSSGHGSGCSCPVCGKAVGHPLEHMEPVGIAVSARVRKPEPKPESEEVSFSA